MSFSSSLNTNLVILFFLLLLKVIIFNPNIFTKKYGRRHSVTGALYLIWLLIGCFELLFNIEIINIFIYHVVLGLLGTILSLTAYYDFYHKHIKNDASGTLDENATVTNGEMLEHSFYQGLNLIQVVYFHLISSKYIININLIMKLSLILLVTSPWLIRSYFPINHFSTNYNDKKTSSSSFLIQFLYRIKKYQYLFYKHFLLHGLNISCALYSINLIEHKYFRLYWILLNTSYVMEFFLQTLVKKKFMSQSLMLFMQKVLMFASTISALPVLQHVNIYISILSLILNLIHRGKDMINVGVIVFIIYIIYSNFEVDQNHLFSHFSYISSLYPNNEI